MAERIYVAGPVVDQHESVPRIYNLIQEEAEAQGWEVELPLRNPQVDALDPRRFTRWTTSRLDSAARVVAVLPRDDQSVPVESTLAALARKPQLVVADSPKSVPRLIAGLPRVEGVVDTQDEEGIRHGVRELLRVRGSEPPPLATA